MRRCRWWIVVGVALVASVAEGDALDSVSYSLFVAESTLFVQPDLSPIVTAGRVRSLKDGLSLRVDCQVSLQRPKRLLGVQELVAVQQAVTLDYHLASAAYRVQPTQGNGESVRTVGSLARLHRYLADSLTIAVAHVGTLDAEIYYRLQLTVTCYRPSVLTSLTESNEADSPLMYIFGRFLEATGYGQAEYHVHSPEFRIGQIPGSP
ncbi:MAG: DUF4390 domain-containing protein [bacterium]